MSQGKCYLCGRIINKRGAIRHLKKCLKEEKINKNIDVFHIGLFAYGDYWLHIEIPTHYTLKDLDQFIRDIWVECCGHLSEFVIKDIRYAVYPSVYSQVDLWGEKPRSMRVKLKNVLKEGDTFSYIYDFGSSTEIELKVFAQRKGPGFRILMRNLPLEFQCKICGKKASFVCPFCYETFCEECVDKHAAEADSDREDMLPIVNSPRCGICGYEGSEKYGDI
jgi:hypothetical protein